MLNISGPAFHATYTVTKHNSTTIQQCCSIQPTTQATVPYKGYQ